MPDADHTRAETRFFQGNRLMADGDAVGAERCYRETLALWPECAEAHVNLGLLVEARGARADAEACYRRGLALDEALPEGHLNLGALLARKGLLVEAETAYRRALDLAPDSVRALSNLGALYAGMRRDGEAESCCRRALAVAPDATSARVNLAYLLLRQGRWDEGWRCLEARDWYRALEPRLACPRWEGQSLDGRSIVVVYEAGHGDVIQFCRYAPLLRARGAGRITLLCHPALTRLLTTLDGVDEVIGFDEAPPAGGWDCWTPLLSLPFHFGTRVDSVPAPIPYLHAASDRVAHWRDRIPRDGLRVGLVWKGNPRFENDAERSLASLALLAPLGGVDGVTFVSLQKGQGEDEARQPPRGLRLHHLGDDIRDFADTAAIVADLDLVIAVDTAVAHLCGALGRPCWILLPDYMPDWRWLDGREDSPWYPGIVRLFRRSAGDGWAPVIARVRAALVDCVARGAA